MELRRVEDEVKSHCKSWRDLCRPSGGACNGDSMPTLKDLFSRLNDEDIFPSEPEEEPEDVEDDIQMKEDEKMVEAAKMMR